MATNRKEAVMQPFFSGHPKRDGAAILPLMVAMSLLVVLAIVLLATVPTTWMLIAAVSMLLAAIAADVLWLSQVLADDDGPSLPRKFSRRARDSAVSRPSAPAVPRASDRAPTRGPRMAMLLAGLRPLWWGERTETIIRLPASSALPVTQQDGAHV